MRWNSFVGALLWYVSQRGQRGGGCASEPLSSKQRPCMHPYHRGEYSNVTSIMGRCCFYSYSLLRDSNCRSSERLPPGSETEFWRIGHECLRTLTVSRKLRSNPASLRRRQRCGLDSRA